MGGSDTDNDFGSGDEDQFDYELPPRVKAKPIPPPFFKDNDDPLTWRWITSRFAQSMAASKNQGSAGVRWEVLLGSFLMRAQANPLSRWEELASLSRMGLQTEHVGDMKSTLADWAEPFSVSVGKTQNVCNVKTWFEGVFNYRSPPQNAFRIKGCILGFLHALSKYKADHKRRVVSVTLNLDARAKECPRLENAINLFQEKHPKEFELWDSDVGIQLPHDVQPFFKEHEDPEIGQNCTWTLPYEVTTADVNDEVAERALEDAVKNVTKPGIFGEGVISAKLDQIAVILEKKRAHLEETFKSANQQQEEIQRFASQEESFRSDAAAAQTCRHIVEMVALDYCLRNSVREVNFDTDGKAVLEFLGRRIGLEAPQKDSKPSSVFTVPLNDKCWDAFLQSKQEHNLDRVYPEGMNPPINIIESIMQMSRENEASVQIEETEESEDRELGTNSEFQEGDQEEGAHETNSTESIDHQTESRLEDETKIEKWYKKPYETAAELKALARKEKSDAKKCLGLNLMDKDQYDDLKKKVNKRLSKLLSKLSTTGTGESSSKDMQKQNKRKGPYTTETTKIVQKVAGKKQPVNSDSLKTNKRKRSCPTVAATSTNPGEFSNPGMADEPQQKKRKPQGRQETTATTNATTDLDVTAQDASIHSPPNPEEDASFQNPPTPEPIRTSVENNIPEDPQSAETAQFVTTDVFSQRPITPTPIQIAFSDDRSDNANYNSDIANMLAVQSIQNEDTVAQEIDDFIANQVLGMGESDQNSGGNGGSEMMF